LKHPSVALRTRVCTQTNVYEVKKSKTINVITISNATLAVVIRKLANTFLTAIKHVCKTQTAQAHLAQIVALKDIAQVMSFAKGIRQILTHVTKIQSV
jgi:hypothetical protein